METILPLVAEYDVSVIGICNDESGISYDPTVRLAVAKKIVERAETYGIARADVILDPLAMPVGAVNTAGVDLFNLVRMVREELGCNTVCGASNVSFGMPNRRLLDSVFVPMVIGSGMTCAITNPLHHEIRNAIYAADVMMGHDESCMRYLQAMRAAESSGTDAPAEGERRSSRSRRRASRSRRASAGE